MERALRLPLPMMCVLMAALCSGPAAATGGTPTGGSANRGTALITVTDAPGDFITYLVEVDSLKLTRTDGLVVEALPAPARVDFAGLTNLSEIIGAERIAPGRYVSAAITLDYNDATIVVDSGSAGVTIMPGHIIDGATGKPLAAPNPTRVTLQLALDRDHPLIIRPQGVSDLALDFNLATSNTVTPSQTDPVTVSVQARMTADLTPDPGKQIHVRGALVSVNAPAGSYIIDLRASAATAINAGRLTISAAPDAIYQINGTGYAGNAGLAQLATLAAGTPTAAYGSWDAAGRNFTASSVLVGSNVADFLPRRSFTHAQSLLPGAGDGLQRQIARRQQIPGMFAHQVAR
jgi:hypothetical protein